MRKIAGYVLLIMLFFFVFGLCVVDIGLKAAIVTWITALTISALFLLSIKLIVE